MHVVVFVLFQKDVKSISLSTHRPDHQSKRSFQKDVKSISLSTSGIGKLTPYAFQKDVKSISLSTFLYVL